MAIASSGAIRLANDIGTELGQSSNTLTSLRQASEGDIENINPASDDRPDENTPHSMSEFHGYDHSASSGYVTSEYFDTSTYGSISSKLMFRADANMGTCYDPDTGGTSVTDIGSFALSGTMENGVTHTPSTSTTSPGYWTFDGTNDRIDFGYPTSSEKWTGDSFGATNAGTTVFVWHRSHNSHNGIMLSSDDGTRRNFQVKCKSDGTKGGVVYYSSVRSSYRYPGWGDDYTLTNFVSGFSHNNWELLCVNFRKYKGTGSNTNKSWIYNYTQKDGGSASSVNANEWYSTSQYCMQSGNEVPSVVMGTQSGSNTTNPYDGDIGSVWVFSSTSFTWADWNSTAKFDDFYNATKAKYGH